jgi:hypothetical protein
MHVWKRASIRCAVMMLTALLIGCGGGELPPSGPIVSTPRQFSPFQLTVSANRATYSRGEPIPLTLTVRNISTQPVTAISNFAFFVGGRVTLHGRTVWDTTLGNHAAVIGNLSFQPGETRSFALNWDQTDLQGNSVAIGQYTLKLWFAPDTINGTDVSAQAAEANWSANDIAVTISGL